MNIKKELKLNRFKMVRIPSRGQLFRQYGEIQGQLKYSGDNLADTHGTRKSDAYADTEELMKQWDQQRENESQS